MQEERFTDRLTDRQPRVERGSGVLEDDAHPLSQAFIDDMKKIDNVFGKTEKVEVPWLILHGDADDVVPVEEGRKMYASAYEPKELVILPGVDHVYSGDGLGQMTEAVVSWLKGHQR